MPKKGDLDLCLYCRRRITYGPYFYRKGKVKKRWTHSYAMRSCLTKPERWKGKWPKAKPLSGLP
jgi:hypothetical protein